MLINTDRIELEAMACMTMGDRHLRDDYRRRSTKHELIEAN